MSDFHDRMPSIVPPESYADWLAEGANSASLLALLRPFPASRMAVRPVSGVVGSTRNEGLACLASPEPVQAMLF